MRLILIRHGKAEDPDPTRKIDDASRALTSEGKRKMRAAARGLRRLHPRLDLLATSPRKRAVQTAEIVRAAYGKKTEVIELDLLAGGNPPGSLIAWLKEKVPTAASVGLVGHEPDLSRWVGLFLTGKEKSIVTMKKGAACVIEFRAAPAPGKGVMPGLYQPGALRKIAAR